jgi:hypothetical protein
MQWEKLKGINPEFVNMVIRTVQGEMSVNDTLTANPEAAAAKMLQMRRTAEVNEGLIAAIFGSHLFESGLVNCLNHMGRQTTNEEKVNVLALHVAQSILIGMHMHEQLLDKDSKGLLRS